MNEKVFISYASEDKARADRVAGELRKRKLEVWFAQREIGASDDFVKLIERGLATARTVLVLWSRHAAASSWVEHERTSTIARRGNGEPIGLVMARLDEEELPPLARSEIALDLRDAGDWSDLDQLVEVIEPTKPKGDLVSRVRGMEIDRSEQVEQVMHWLRRGSSVVVLAPRKGGSHWFTRQVVARIRRDHPCWDARTFVAQTLATESLDDYIKRMRLLVEFEAGGDGQVVASIHGWSHSNKEYQTKLGFELRARMEGGIPNARPFCLVAAGSYPLFLLRNGPSDLSALNSCHEVFLPDFTIEQILDCMQKIKPDWTSDDAKAVWRHSGGHAHLVKHLLFHWAKNPEGGWIGAAGRLEDDEDFLLPRLRAAALDDERKRTLLKCLAHPDGLRFPRINPHSPALVLYFDGLLRREGRRLVFRCPTIERLVSEEIAEA